MTEARRRTWRQVGVGVVLGLALTLVIARANAEQPIQRFVWSELQRDGKLATGTVLAPRGSAGFAALRIQNDTATPKRYTLLIIDAPPIRELRWRVTGQVRYQNVAGEGYFDLLNVLPSGAYFTRSLAPEGPLGVLSGTSDWRPFVLPFDATQGGQPPNKLILSVVLPGRGTVDVGPVEIFEGGSARDVSPGAWWGARTAGWVFGALGTLLGCLGGLLGTLVGLGRARRFVLAAGLSAAGVCAASLLGGLLALARGQPHEVVYPLLLLGIIGVIVFGSGYRMALQRYRQRELRKMRAMDASV